jgi:hypothetical protein
VLVISKVVGVELSRVDASVVIEPTFENGIL